MKKMKLWLTVVLLTAMSVCGLASPADGRVPELKKAILMAYYGTLDDSARVVSFDALTARVRQAFPGVEVREAFTSRATASAMRRQTGREHPLVTDALQQLEADGYNSIIVVSGELLHGKTARLMEQQVDTMSYRFFEVKTTTPLLYTADDCRKVMPLLVQAAQVGADEQCVFVTHGKNGADDAVLCLADYVLQHEGYANCHVGTAEGYPSMQNIRQQLQLSGSKRVVLVPLMMVGGGHAKRTVGKAWRETLEADGYSVRALTGGVLDVPAIQQLIIDRIKETDRQP
ncbi:MAG: sirohydrochlorin cobaltochelatase [Prevotella sp.]|nr:sirohydrochlorin cobaltochelatase [Prevotella sp.]